MKQRHKIFNHLLKFNSKLLYFAFDPVYLMGFAHPFAMGFPIQLACVMPTTSLNPEPGSNSLMFSRF